ncbi:MAG: preprotein translocase subunit SecY [Opitutales bacterium]
MFSAFFNCFKIPELRQRILFTLGMIFVARVGANIPLPGLDTGVLAEVFAARSATAQADLAGLFNMFTGGALRQGAVFALGIMPYISASIILQLMGAVVPSLARLQQEGEIGRQKITQYTRYLTIAIGLVQSLLLALGIMRSPQTLFGDGDFTGLVIVSPWLFVLMAVIFMTSGVVLLMWIGEQISMKGIGNGISLLITIGILADLPNAATQLWNLATLPDTDQNPLRLTVPEIVLLFIIFVVVIVAIVWVTQGMRKIPVQYAKRIVGRKQYGGTSSFLPLRVNYAGVMPIIFASAILMFPQAIFTQLASASETLRFLENWANFMRTGTWFYFVFSAMLILGFSYFWVSIMFKPIQIADDLKKNGGYIPGVRPGEPTSRYLDFVMTRLTLFGAVFLTLVWAIPYLISSVQNIPFTVSIFFGGTGTLIAVGVTLDTMRQIETFLLQRHYDGFLKKGRIRSGTRRRQTVDAGEIRDLGLGKLWAALLTLFTIGMIAWLVKIVFGVGQ